MAASKPILYSAWISSCSFRVRIALNLKGVDYEYRAVTRTDLDYEKINPIKYVPALVDGDFVISDSLAIILGLLDGKLGSDESLQIVRNYTDKGFKAIEKLLEGCDSKYATGDEVQLADVFLAPQIHAGLTRFQIDMSNYPLLERFYKAYMEIPAFQVAAPEKQPDAPASPY